MESYINRTVRHVLQKAPKDNFSYEQTVLDECASTLRNEKYHTFLNIIEEHGWDFGHVGEFHDPEDNDMTTAVRYCAETALKHEVMDVLDDVLTEEKRQ